MRNVNNIFHFQLRFLWLLGKFTNSIFLKTVITHVWRIISTPQIASVILSIMQEKLIPMQGMYLLICKIATFFYFV